MTDSTDNTFTVDSTTTPVQQQQIASQILGLLRTGNTFKLNSSPGDTQGAAAANNIAAIVQSEAQTANSSSTTNEIGNAVMPVLDFLTNPVAGSVKVAQSAASSGGGDWISAHAANYGLVILGIVLGVGALLISQKETIVKIGETAAEVAA